MRKKKRDIPEIRYAIMALGVAIIWSLSSLVSLTLRFSSLFIDKWTRSEISNSSRLQRGAKGIYYLFRRRILCNNY